MLIFGDSFGKYIEKWLFCVRGWNIVIYIVNGRNVVNKDLD